MTHSISNVLPGMSALLLLGLTAQAANLYILADDAKLAPVSGVKSTAGRAGHGGDFQGIYGIKLYEDNDKACKATGMSRHLNNSTEKVAAFVANDCSNPGSEKTARFAEKNTYVRGVQVCHKGGGGKYADMIKGIRLYGARLDKNTGALDAVSGFKEIVRPNCSDWKATKYCPVGKVASQIEMQYQANPYGPDYFVGARLLCRTVDPK